MDPGQELFFELKFSPSYTQNSKKVQYIQSHIKNTNDGTSPRREQTPNLILEWFKARTELFGFEVNSLEITSDIKRTIPKPGNPYPINEIGVSGILTVTDLSKFKSTLYNGIGRNKRNGCGLLLIS
jgi:CRISPR-associated protein Cas6/Cse3/CasE subtype I-E